MGGGYAAAQVENKRVFVCPGGEGRDGGVKKRKKLCETGDEGRSVGGVQ